MPKYKIGDLILLDKELYKITIVDKIYYVVERDRYVIPSYFRSCSIDYGDKYFLKIENEKVARILYWPAGQL